jgi:hypothetical protein
MGKQADGWAGRLALPECGVREIELKANHMQSGNLPYPSVAFRGFPYLSVGFRINHPPRRRGLRHGEVLCVVNDFFMGLIHHVVGSYSLTLLNELEDPGTMSELVAGV